MNTQPQQQRQPAQPENSARPAHDDLENLLNYVTLRNDYWSLKAQHDALLSACQTLADFSYTDYAAKWGEQSALQELVAIKRKARRAIAKTQKA